MIFWLKCILLILDCIVLLIAIERIIKKVYFVKQSLFFKWILINSIAELIFYFLPQNYFLVLTINTIYHLIFLGMILIHKLSFKFNLYFYLMLLLIVLFSFYSQKSISVFEHSSSVLFVIPTFLIAIELYNRKLKPNLNSVHLLLIFCILLFEIVYDLINDQFICFNKDQLKFFISCFMLFLFVTRTYFISYYGFRNFNRI